MRAVVQRVRQASVAVEGKMVGQIDQGLLVFLGVGKPDTQEEVLWLAHKIANLRIFSDDEGKMNLSVKAIKGAVLVISQFTLYGNIHKGFRPSFVDAAAPEIAEPLIDDFIKALQSEDMHVESGIFRADMQVSLINDGPVTILMEK